MNFIYIYNYKFNILNKIKYIIDFSVSSVLKFSNRKSVELIDITKKNNQIITLNQNEKIK